MLDSAGPTALTSKERNWTTGRSYLKDLPEAIKAHLARAGAAKSTGVEGNFGMRISDFGISARTEQQIAD
jgi:hypothetical protein